jgi:hypothetical protein
MTESPADLLGDLQQLRRKVRRDRRGYAFPLLLFGILILAAPLCYEALPMTLDDTGSYIERPNGPFPVFMYLWAPLRNDILVQWYWMLALLVGFGATTWWYRRRAQQVGVETDLRGYLVAAGAGVVGLVFGVPVLEATATPGGLYSTPEVNLPILFVATAASVLACAIGVRWPRWRPYAVPAGVLLGTIALAAVGVYMIYGFSALLIIAVALLVLAWVERSPLLGVVGMLFTVVSVHANLQGMAHYFSIYEQDSRLVVLTDLALPGAVLIIGGVIALLQSRRAAR